MTTEALKATATKRLGDSAEAQALAKLTQIPKDDDGDIVFAEPWQAEVFAITLTLHQQGLFSWAEWTEVLSAKIKDAQQAGDADLGDTYYLHWLSALESMVIRKQVGTHDSLRNLYQRWDDAAKNTPHGRPIVID